MVKLPRSGRSAAWLARLVRDQEVEGSNPFAPTTFSIDFNKRRRLVRDQEVEGFRLRLQEKQAGFGGLQAANPFAPTTFSIDFNKRRHLVRDQEVEGFRLRLQEKQAGFGGLQTANPFAPTISFNYFLIQLLASTSCSASCSSSPSPSITSRAPWAMAFRKS